MSDPTDRYYLARLDPQTISKASPQSIETTTTQGTIHPQQNPPRIVVQIVQQPAAQITDSRPSHYTTEKDRGNHQPLPKLQLPNLLTLTLSVTVGLLLVVAASMFSISLTAYSNSVDRVDHSRSFIHVE